MGLFSRKQPQPALPQFDMEACEPVIRSSICTGEKVACMRERDSGRLHEVMLIRTEEDLDSFCRSYGLEREKIKTVY